MLFAILHRCSSTKERDSGMELFHHYHRPNRGKLARTMMERDPAKGEYVDPNVRELLSAPPPAKKEETEQQAATQQKIQNSSPKK